MVGLCACVCIMFLHTHHTKGERSDSRKEVTQGESMVFWKSRRADVCWTESPESHAVNKSTVGVDD